MTPLRYNPVKIRYGKKFIFNILSELMKLRLLLITCALFPLSTTTVYGHHSFQASYDTENVIRIEGTLVGFMLRNPHSHVYVMAPDENGVMRRWGVEWGGASVLMRQGLTRDSLKAGDHVIITGNPGRNPGDYRLRMQTLHRPADGFGWGNREGESFD